MIRFGAGIDFPFFVAKGMDAESKPLPERDGFAGAVPGQSSTSAVHHGGDSKAELGERDAKDDVSLQGQTREFDSAEDSHEVESQEDLKGQGQRDRKVQAQDDRKVQGPHDREVQAEDDLSGTQKMTLWQDSKQKN